MVKRDEALEVKRSKTLYPIIDGVFNLVDVRMLNKSFGYKDNETLSNLFLDLIVQDGDSMKYNEHLRNKQSLYPVAPTNKNFTGPYLTPRKHLEYCAFWFGTASIGFSSILFVLFKLK